MEKDTDSTVTSLEENTENFCENPTRDILAEGLTNLFKQPIDRLDERVRATRAAQAELNSQLDSLIALLNDIDEAQTSIPFFNEKVKKLINAKHKVTVIANVLQTSQERLNNLHSLIEKEQLKGQNLLESGSSSSS